MVNRLIHHKILTKNTLKFAIENLPIRTQYPKLKCGVTFKGEQNQMTGDLYIQINFT